MVLFHVLSTPVLKSQLLTSFSLLFLMQRSVILSCECSESDLTSVSFASPSLDKTRNSTGPCLLGLRSCVYAEAVQVAEP